MGCNHLRPPSCAAAHIPQISPQFQHAHTLYSCPPWRLAGPQLPVRLPAVRVTNGAIDRPRLKPNVSVGAKLGGRPTCSRGTEQRLLQQGCTGEGERQACEQCANKHGRI